MTNRQEKFFEQIKEEYKTLIEIIPGIKKEDFEGGSNLNTKLFKDLLLEYKEVIDELLW